jgi:hypothetical protein
MAAIARIQSPYLQQLLSQENSDETRRDDLIHLAQFVRIEPRGWEDRLWFEHLKDQYPTEFKALSAEAR